MQLLRPEYVNLKEKKHASLHGSIVFKFLSLFLFFFFFFFFNEIQLHSQRKVCVSFSTPTPGDAFSNVREIKTKRNVFTIV